MKKVLILILAVILSLSVFAMAACQQPCETHVDGNHDGICDVCEATGLSVTHTDSNHDGKCDGCGGAAQFQHVDAAHDGQCDVCKKPVEITHVDANNDGTCDVCQVLVDHAHADANNDGICDIPACDYEFPWVADLASAKEYVNSMYLMGAEVTAADFKLITNVPVGTANFTITWEIQSEVEGQTAVVLGEIDQTTKQQLVDVDTASAAEVAYKLVGTISDEAGHTTTVEYSRLVPIGFKMSQVHPYVGSIYQGTLGKTLYLDGGVSGRYLTMTENASKAVSVYAEEVKGGYKLYILDGETKKYITIYANGEGKTSVNYDANGETVYAYNPSINAFFTTFNNGEVYLGTYSNYNTVSVSATSYITPENTGVSQFPLEMLPIADGATYAAFITQAQQEKVVYVTGEVSGRYLATSESEASAVVIYAEKVAGGYKFYKLNGETKEYITIYANDEGKDSVKFDANGETVFAYDPVVNAWVSNFNDKDKYLGTYSSYTTVSVSNLSYITAENTGKSQFPLEFKAVEAGAPAHECANVCPVCGKCTNEDCAESVCANKCEGHKPVAGPVVGQAYIMSVNQGNLGKTLYFNGQTRAADNLPWYFKTSENKDDAVSVFVEETTGGFHLYFMDGETKTYIRLYEREADKASLALVTEAPAEVYTWDETYATLKVTVGEHNYYIGTYGTYNTLSGNSYSKIVGSFPCAYTPVGGSVVPPVEEHECESKCPTCGGCLDATCTEEACATKCPGHEVVEDGAPIAGTYVLEMYQSKKGQNYYFTGTMSGYYFATSTNKADAVEITLAKLENGKYTMKLANGQYLAIVASGTHLNAVMQSAVCEWTWNAEIGSFTAQAGSEVAFLGTYGDYYTIGGSKLSYASTSYVAKLVDPAIVPPVESHECANVCPTCGKCTNEDCAESVCANKCEGHEVVEASQVVLTVTSLGLKSQSYAAGTVTVDGSTFEFIQLGNYGNGIQMRDKDGNTSRLWNTVAFSKPIARIELVYSSTQAVKYANSNAVIFSFGNASDNLTYTTKLSTTAGQKNYTITPDAETYTFFKLEHDLGYTFYWDSITIVFAEDVAPAHTCESVCPECGKCLDAACTETACANKCEGHKPTAVVINGTNYSEDQAEAALLALKADDVVTILANATIAQEYTFVAANYTIGEGAVLVAQANMVAPAGAKLTVSANAKLVVEAGVQIDISALTQEDFATSTQARLEIAEGATVIMPAYTEQLWKDAYLKAVIEAMVADSDVGAKLVLGETKLTKTANGWEAEAPAALEDVVINVSDIATTGEFATEQVLAEGVSVLAAEGKTVKINSNSKSIDGFSFTQRLQLGGTMAQDNRAIKAEIKGAATITIYAISSSSNEGEERNMLLKNSAFETVATQVVGISICKAEYKVTEAGTYYIGSEKSGINIYYLAIAYEKAPVVPAHTCESVCEECGKCLDADCTEEACASKCEGHAPVAVTATISFADKANRTVLTTSQQVWVQNGITITNNKAASTSNVADYAKPARFYASSELIVEAEGKITEIVFHCNSGKPAISLGTIAGATVTKNGYVVTVTFEAPVDSFTVAKLSAQVRMDSIDVTYIPA